MILEKAGTNKILITDGCVSHGTFLPPSFTIQNISLFSFNDKNK